MPLNIPNIDKIGECLPKYLKKRPIYGSRKNKSFDLKLNLKYNDFIVLIMIKFWFKKLSLL